MITIDFETYYDKEFSLSKITTEEYIRSEQFEVIGVAAKVDDQQTQWCTGSKEQIAKFLHGLDLPSHDVLAHHMAFDGAILAWQFGIRPKYYLDTLSMARPLTGLTVGGSLAALAKKFELGAKGTEVVNALGKRREDFSPQEIFAYGTYCMNDVNLTYELFKILKPHSTTKELYIIDLMLRMYIDPVLELDKEKLTHHLSNVQTKKEELMRRISDAIGKDDLMSNMKFADVLKKLGVEPPMKVSLRTNKMTYAFGKTDYEFKALLEHEDPRVQAVVSARLGIKSTLEETRTISFLGIADRGALPIMLNYYGAHTGRASGGDKMNLQNLPRGGTLRKSIKAPEGHVVIAVDSAQIEARVVAWLAGQDDLVEDFRNGVDIYSKFASDVYERPIDKSIDKVERFVGKTCVAEGTLVLSDSGWKPIEQVSLHDKLWDGEEWVCHQGLLNNGIKPTLSLCGAWLTPDHQVWSGTQWLEAQSVVADEDTLYQALDTGAENLPSQATLLALGMESTHSSLNATATNLSTKLTTTISKTSKALGVPYVQKRPLAPNDTGFILKPWLTTPIVQDCSTELPQPLAVVIPKLVSTINTTENAGSVFIKAGEKIKRLFLDTFRLLMGGTAPTTRWTELTLMGTMNPAISDLYQEAKTYGTKEKSLILKPVYDILNCGSRNRFTILTEAGPLIVHNCILGLGYGMGKDKFKSTLKIGMAGVSVDLPLEDAERIVRLYRQKYERITSLWADADKALPAIANGFDYKFGASIALCATPEGIRLPNDMLVRYPGLHKTNEGFVYTTKRGSIKIYGGKVVENVVQALARIVVFDQMAKIDQEFRKRDSADTRFKVALTVHDEVVAVVPKIDAQRSLDFMIKVMSTPPQWAQGLPVACEGDFALTYGDCK